MQSVKFKIDADGSGAKAAILGVRNEIKGLTTSVQSMGAAIKGSIIATLGIQVVRSMTGAVMDFAGEVQDASDRLGVSTKRVQELRHAARQAGLDFKVFDKIFASMDETFKDALSGDKGKMSLLKKLGLNEDEVNRLNSPDALNKILFGSMGMSNTDARASLKGIFGARGASQLMMMRGDLLEGDAPVASQTAINKLSSLGDAFEKLKDTVIVTLMPALETFADFIQEKFGGSTSLLGAFNKNKNHPDAPETSWMRKALHVFAYMNDAQLSQKHRIKDWVMSSVGLQSDTLGGVMGKIERERREKILLKGLLGNELGEKAFNDLEKGRIDAFVKRQAKEREAAEGDKALDDPVDRSSVFNRDRKSEAKTVVPPIIQRSADMTSNAMIRIGNSLGIEAQYRMQKLSIEANSHLEAIRASLKKIEEDGLGTTTTDSQIWGG